MYWNHRLVDMTQENGEPFFEVCEVFYSDDGMPAGWARASVCGETLAEVKEEITRFMEALNKPTLQPEDFIGKFREDHESSH